MEYIVITKEEYELLLVHSQKYQLLEEFGVDNWNGYSEVMNEFEDTQNNTELKYELFSTELSILLQPFIEI